MTTQSRKKRVYLVEDEAVLVLSLEAMLDDLGFDFLGSSDNFDDALKDIENLSPDAVILDIKIKGDKTGIEVAEELFKRKKCAVIFLTANADRINFNKARKTFPYAFLEKPIRETQLKSSLELAIMQYEFQENRQLLKDRMANLELEGKGKSQQYFLTKEVLPPLLDTYEKMEELLEDESITVSELQECAEAIKGVLKTIALELGEQ